MANDDSLGDEVRALEGSLTIDFGLSDAQLQGPIALGWWLDCLQHFAAAKQNPPLPENWLGGNPNWTVKNLDWTDARVRVV